MEHLFWIAGLFVLYTYFGYPLLLWLIGALRGKEVKKAPITPPLTFIITAYNEEERIAEKIENTLGLEYPRERLQIIVASDASTDRTDEIVRAYASQGVELVRAPERRGKEHAQKLAVEAAKGEILVFSDVATVLKPDSLRKLAANFGDPSVGCVSSEDRVLEDRGNGSGEGYYVRYEMWLRRLESRARSVVGLSGSYFAARKEVCHPWREDLQSDFNTVLNAIRSGMRGVSDPEVIGYYRSVSSGKEEFRRKVRTVIRGLNVFTSSLSLLNPFRYGLFSLELLSHKLFRWLVPFALVALLLSNFFLIPAGPFYRVSMALQGAFYLGAALALFDGRLAKRAPFRIPLFFSLTNFSILVAWFRYLKGERMAKWEPSRR